MSSFHPRNREPLRDPAGDPIDPPPPPPRDELDSLLRQWHQDNADRAAAGRDRLLASLRDARAQSPVGAASSWTITIRRFAPLAAAAVIALVLIPLFFISNKTAPVAVATFVSNIVMAPDGGRLDAFDPRGDLLGPCVLKHTDVNAVVNGPFTRVTLTQKYHNPHKDKIEAVYTFPLSHRASVDQMTMATGDRVIIGEVKERNLAREMYEAARETGRVASLLEQERPNIFTQSIANIEPGADIDITISYIEQLDSHDGDYEFQFPTVVGPRYIPGGSSHNELAPIETRASRAAEDATDAAAPPVPDGFVSREGVNLPAPAQITPLGDVAKGIDTSTLAARIPAAEPLAPAPGVADPATALGAPISVFECAYPDGSREQGRLYATDVGEVAGRWFRLLPPAGAPFARPSAEVPDADRITPTPTRPETRAGHDLSITVTIDTGGPGLVDIESPLHKVTRQDVRLRPDGMPSRATITLTNESAIPNRDFVLKWRQSAPGVLDSVFTTRTDLGDFFAVILQPPNRIEDAAAIPRELVFVLDTSGSMRGPPIDASKAVAQTLIASMRPQDRFNVVTFSGDTCVLWPEPRPTSDANRAEALQFFDHRDDSGGTEMMSAIEAALRGGSARADQEDATPEVLTPSQLASLPADGRIVAVRIEDHDLDSSGLTTESVMTAGRIILDTQTDPPTTARAENVKLPRTYLRRAAEHLHDDTKLALMIRGRWTTEPGQDPERALIAESTILADEAPVLPLRIVVFLTDGQVGNDHAIIDAIQRHRAGTRVFTIGIGNSVNRYLLDGMARAGGGVADYILIPPNNTSASDPAARQQFETDITAVAQRLNQRTRSPVLTHISAEFSPGLAVADLEPAADRLSDLFDARPIVLLGRLLEPAGGSLTLRGQTVAGPWERNVQIRLEDSAAGRFGPPAGELGESVVPDLWARARIDTLLADHLADLQTNAVPPDIRSQVVQLGETFDVMSPFTSFVAVDHKRVTIDGKPTLVPIPIELPDSTQWDGFFGADIPARAAAEAIREQNSALKKADQFGRLDARGHPTYAGSKETLKRGAGKGEGAVAAPRGGGATSAPAPVAAPPPEPIAPGTAAADRSPPAAKPSAPPERKVSLVDKQPREESPAALAPGGSPSPRPEFPILRSKARSSDLEAPPANGPELDQARQLLRDDISTQNLAAESFYKNIAEQLDVTASLGQAAPDRLAVAAGANFIAQNVRGGQIAAADRARELFLNRYPDSQLLNDASAVIANVKQQSLQSPTAVTGANAAPERADTPAGIEKDAAKAIRDEAVPSVEDFTRRAEQYADRERLLRRRLDPRLYELLPAPMPNPATQNTRNQFANDLSQNSLRANRQQAQNRAMVQVGPEVVVSVLLENLDDAALEALKVVGFRLETRMDDVKTVVGAIPISRLEALALLDAVRRVEPVTRP
jgi:hypothetical protein